MSAEIICQFNKFGFCKFRTNCFRKHESRKCENEHCDIRECPLRHPKKCRYFVEFKNCKFGTYCKFGHDAIENKQVDKEIETIKKQLEEVKHDIGKKENEMKLRDEEIKTLAISMEQKNIALENRIQTLEVNLEELRNENKVLRAQFIAQKMDEEEIDTEALDDIESEVEIDIEETIEASKVYEENYEEQNNPLKCDKCDFFGKNGAGLKIHITAKHKENPPVQQKPLMQRFSRVTK